MTDLRQLAIAFVVFGAAWTLVAWCAFGAWTYFERQRFFDSVFGKRRR